MVHGVLEDIVVVHGVVEAADMVLELMAEITVVEVVDIMLLVEVE